MLNEEVVRDQTSFDAVDTKAVNAVRMLSMDMISRAKSGHPGLPLGASPMAYVLFSRHLRVDPSFPQWFNRDRFVLSAGHGSSMLYSLLNLSGFAVSRDDLMNFRQLGSKTPGHPEYGVTPGVDATTGPLGQGVGMAVGMAMAEMHLAAQYNRPNFNVVDHYTYAICGDGDLMEGVAAESASLAGQLKLNKLIVLYDSNDVSLDGPLTNACHDDVAKRFESYGWNYLRVADGNDLSAIDDAICAAKDNQNGPTLIEVKTVIGAGSPNAGTNKVHGAPLNEADLAATREYYDWDNDPFTVPEEVTDRFMNTIKARGWAGHQEWSNLIAHYSNEEPELSAQFAQGISQTLPASLDADLPTYYKKDALASRASGHEILQRMSEDCPNLWGGSADLFSSNKTAIADDDRFSADNPTGRNLWFGVREFAEAAAMNGIALHGGTRVYGSTFFVFSDYMKPAIRLAALQQLPVIYVFTHDSLAVGEDGPTHEPVEQMAALRAIPGLTVYRPADGNETAAVWQEALQATDHPTAIVLTRQGLPTLPKPAAQVHTGVHRGGYVVADAQDEAEGILMASGSEVQLALDAQARLLELGHDVRVVSVPSFEKFNAQSAEYRDTVLPTKLRRRVAIEMASGLGWCQYVGLDGAMITQEQFGASGNGGKVVAMAGFTPENVVQSYLQLK
ncbi:transketolase [Levilactobacillus senmaizukei DSM 21775 = NBRC 103853]|uniref:Transketolase n=1 Tax=Levilactobacillus senmaizukei DSM 21775 = NBRC 103853 TaxID=1423803 RepID=A0A0R2DM30_9LACO|nr:transketolase [Levilactobacillus senmaizukei]KRN02837.1 transketolase [Levilactobacillus senmaizukei DSM 21775 = NBRC 103853]